jgi:hypothetical protein
MKKSAVLVLLVLLWFGTVEAQDRPDLPVSRAAEAPKIDGILDDEVWNEPALPLADWLSYNPLYGEKQQQRTEVRVAYDDRNLYFAFHCFDAEHGKIRTTISRRDNAFNDDWVGISLDSAGTGQTSYHLLVNPNGIQMDALNTASSGEKWDADIVWDSGGNLTDDGYTVEIKLPLQSIRFKSGADVRMGIMFFRRISRLGVSWSWPDIPPGLWVFNRHAHLVFSELKQPPLLEVLPSFTHGINQSRVTPDRWNESKHESNAGVSTKYGITSSITLDATINPDFSQVESDAFEVQVNQRFPIFFSEKRPFFMEGMGLFNIAGVGGDGNMRTAVHTRRIIDPLWGTKLTGDAGKLTFGVLSASDEAPEIGNKLFTIGRAAYGLGESNYLGVIFTDTEHNGQFNRVAGGDINVRFKRRQQFSTTFLASRTGTASGTTTHATAAQVYYSYNRRAFDFSGQVEHYGKDFQMDTAFYNRTGFTAGWGYGEVNFYPKNTNSWVKRVTPFYWNKLGRDQLQDGNERYMVSGVRMNFTRQGFLRVDHRWGLEPWRGRQFNWGFHYAQGSVQILRWLQLNGNFTKGWATYYDPSNPFQGRSTNTTFGFTLQPNLHFNENISYNGVLFDRASDGTRVFSVHIVNMRTTYQFDKHFLVRVIEQFDSSQRRLLTDLLASYELIPGTVFHAGYGSLFEKRGFEGGTLIPNVGNYLTTSRSLFFKASYLHRF